MSQFVWLPGICCSEFINWDFRALSHLAVPNATVLLGKMTYILSRYPCLLVEPYGHYVVNKTVTGCCPEPDDLWHFSSFPCVQHALLNSSYVISWFLWYLVKTTFYKYIYIFSNLCLMWCITRAGVGGWGGDWCGCTQRKRQRVSEIGGQQIYWMKRLICSIHQSLNYWDEYKESQYTNIIISLKFIMSVGIMITHSGHQKSGYTTFNSK